LEPFVREACKQKIDAFADRGGCDLVEDYAKDLPYEVIAHMIGIPLDDQSKVRSWVEIIGRCFEVSPSEEDLQEAAHAAGSYTEYMKALFSERKSTPLHDLVSEYGRPESGMSADEAIANLVLFTVAGFETTSPLISSGLYALLKHADQLELLRKQPDLITAVVEEVLRLEAPIPVTKYHVSESAELGGNTLRAGEKIRLLIGSANRDPEVFENPDVFDINRQNKKHLSFGSGIHYCLGGSLARLEGQISISMVLERFPNLRLSGDTVEYRSVMPRSIVSLPVEF
jgi:Cytochrome P450